MSAAGESKADPPRDWQDLPKEGVFALPLVQTAGTSWWRVRFEATRVPVTTLFDYLFEMTAVNATLHTLETSLELSGPLDRADSLVLGRSWPESTGLFSDRG
ncbi:MAG: hypothetical protein OXN89_04870 [Bryobacterales bacterium]|nr:hypothetical protein [Bryobacterales bacterium]